MKTFATYNLPQTLLVMANSHGFQAQINDDQSVTVWIPSKLYMSVDPHTCQTVHDMRSVLGY